MNTTNNQFPVVFNPHAGSIYKYEISRRRINIQNVGGRNLNSYSIEKMEFSYLINFDLGKGYKNSVQFDSYSITLDTINSSVDQIHEDSISNNTNDIRNVFNGALFDLEINNNGVLKKISGFQDFQQKRGNFISGDIINNKVPLKGRNSYTKDYFKDLFESSLHFFPDSPVFLNSKWVINEFTDIGERHKIDVLYKVDKVQDGNIYVTRFSKVNQKLNFNNNSIEMDGDERGTIQLDSETGMVMQSERVLTINGQMQLGNLPMKMTIENFVTIKGKKLK